MEKRELVIGKTGLKRRHCWTKFLQIRKLILEFLQTVDDVELGGSLSCIDHEMVELSILRGWKKENGRITTPNFRRADFGLCRDLLGRIPCERVLESTLDLGDLFDVQGSPPPSSRMVHHNEQEIKQR